MMKEVLAWFGDSTNLMVVAGIAILLLLLIIVMVRGRKTKPLAKKSPIAAAEPARTDLEEVLEAYRQSHPSFYNVAKTISEKHNLEEFMANGEFAGAVTKLRLWQTSFRGPRADRNNSTLLRIETATAGDSSRQIRAAMITILRILYASPEISAELKPNAEVEMDRLLEALTG